MKNYRVFLSIMLCLMAVGMSAQKLQKGVSQELANQRKANISNIVYDLTFNIPADIKTPITGKAIITPKLDEFMELIGEAPKTE